MFCHPPRSLALCSGTPGVVRVSVVPARTSSRVSRCERRPRAHTDSVARETSQRATRVDTFLAVLRGAQHVPRASCVVPSIWKRPLLILKAPDCCHQRLLADVRFGAAVKRTAVQALLYPPIIPGPLFLALLLYRPRATCERLPLSIARDTIRSVRPTGGGYRRIQHVLGWTAVLEKRLCNTPARFGQ